jgi:hypothetical protein
MIRYRNVCPICDFETDITVLYDQDAPQHCPMCGADAELENPEGEEVEG